MHHLLGQLPVIGGLLRNGTWKWIGVETLECNKLQSLPIPHLSTSHRTTSSPVSETSIRMPWAIVRPVHSLSITVCSSNDSTLQRSTSSIFTPLLLYLLHEFVHLHGVASWDIVWNERTFMSMCGITGAASLLKETHVPWYHRVTTGILILITCRTKPDHNRCRQ